MCLPLVLELCLNCLSFIALIHPFFPAPFVSGKKKLPLRPFLYLPTVVEGNEVADAHLKTLKSVAVFVYPALT
jgi:hypothetical protein